MILTALTRKKKKRNPYKEQQTLTIRNISSNICLNQHRTCYRKKSFAIKSLWSDVSHCRKHGDASVLQFGLAAALEVLHAAIGGEACRVPESDGVLHTELVLEGTQRRCGVVGPVTPGASGQTILPYETMQNRTNTLLTKLTYIVSKNYKTEFRPCIHTHTNTTARTSTSHDFCWYVDTPPERTCR